MGGEKWKIGYLSRNRKGSPPHGRGKGYDVIARLCGVRITPAWAGKRALWSRSISAPRDHPRMGGEKTFRLRKVAPGTGSPPHGRGKVIQDFWYAAVPRITPAWAGKSDELLEKIRGYGDHPRMGGEKASAAGPRAAKEGSPPHGRGKAASAAGPRAAKGITPAWAGKRAPYPASGGRGEDHPRMGGEKPTAIAPETRRPGSPPHGRGKV